MKVEEALMILSKMLKNTNLCEILIKIYVLNCEKKKMKDMMRSNKQSWK